MVTHIEDIISKLSLIILINLYFLQQIQGVKSWDKKFKNAIKNLTINFLYIH